MKALSNTLAASLLSICIMSVPLGASQLHNESHNVSGNTSEEWSKPDIQRCITRLKNDLKKLDSELTESEQEELNNTFRVALGDLELNNKQSCDDFFSIIEKELKPSETFFRGYKEHNKKSYLNAWNASHDKQNKAPNNLYVYLKLKQSIEQCTKRLDIHYILTIILCRTDFRLLEELKKPNLIYLKESLENTSMRMVDKCEPLPIEVWKACIEIEVPPASQFLKKIFRKEDYKRCIGDLAKKLQYGLEAELKHIYQSKGFPYGIPSISSDDQCIAWKTNRTHNIYLLNKNKDQYKKMICEGHENCIKQLDWLSNTVLVSVARDGTVRLWSIEDGSQLATIKLTNEDLYAISCFKDKIFVAGDENLLCVLEKQETVYKENTQENLSQNEVQTGKPKYPLYTAKKLKIRKKKNLSQGTNQKQLQKEIQFEYPKNLSIQNLVYLSDGYIAFEDSGDIYLYDVSNEEILDIQERPDTGIHTMRLSHNRKYLGILGSARTEIEIWHWDANTKSLIKEQSYYERNETYTNITFSNDNLFIIANSDSGSGINIFDFLRQENIKICGLKRCSNKRCLGISCNKCSFSDATFFNKTCCFLTVHRDGSLCTWKPPLKRVINPRIVQFFIVNKWKLYEKCSEDILGLVAKDIFALITNYAYLPFLWRWIK